MASHRSHWKQGWERRYGGYRNRIPGAASDCRAGEAEPRNEHRRSRKESNGPAFGKVMRRRSAAESNRLAVGLRSLSQTRPHERTGVAGIGGLTADEANTREL